MGVVLVPYRELATQAFPESGIPMYVIGGGRFVARTSRFGPLFWEGRAVYDGQKLRYRVALYDGDRRVAIFDKASFTIHDVAFHPTEPIVALGTGSYDGGYAYEGDLIIWNYENGHWHSVLGESRLVSRCRFEPDGRLAILMMPRTDEEDDLWFGTILDDLQPSWGNDARIATLPPIDPAKLGFDVTKRQIEPPSNAPIWDLAWTHDGLIAVGHAGGDFDVWAPDGERVFHRRLGGTVAQLLPQATQLLVHAVTREGSKLHMWRNGKLAEWATFRRPRACSVDASGRILARDVERGSRGDRVLAANGETILEADLGLYDSFNHHLRIDLADGLYFLRGEPATQHKQKQLCRIDRRGDVSIVADWDGGDHLMTGSALLVGGDLVRSYVVYDPKGLGRRRVERMTLAGRVLWRHDVGAAAIAMVYWPAIDAVAAALLDGRLCIYDAATGEVLHDEPFELDGAPTIPTALAVRDEVIVVGTISARIAIFALR